MSLDRLVFALRERGHTDECYSGTDEDCDCPLRVLTLQAPEWLASLRRGDLEGESSQRLMERARASAERGHLVHAGALLLRSISRQRHESERT